jgi:hypothetical protein
METDGEMPECTPEGNVGEASILCAQEGRQRPRKSVHETREAADTALAAATEKAKKGEKFLIEVREGDRTRCSGFCQVAGMCSQYQTYLSTKEKSNGIE